jgi:AcrR family transcriptional regulator
MSNRRMAYAMVLEPTEVEVDAQRLQFHAAFIDQFQRILDAGVAGGEFDVADTRVAAACIFGAATESLMSPLSIAAAKSGKADRKTAGDTTAHVDAVVAFCLRGLGGRQRRRR